MRPDLRLIDTASLAAMTLALGIDHYLQRRGARGARPNTLYAYGTDLRQFAAFAQRLGHGELVAVMSSRHVSRYLDDQTARGVSPRSQARKLAVLRGFFKHARREGWIGHDPTLDEKISFRARRVIAPELDQLHALVDGIGRHRPADLRDRAMLRLALDSGLRISEVASLDVPNCGSQATIDLKRQLAHVVGKGGDTETVTFNERTTRMLEDWLRVRADLAAPGVAALFVTQRGDRFGRQGLHLLIKRRAAATGLGGVHWHLLRHRRICQVLEACGEKLAQQFARHSSLETTSHYGNHASSVAFALVRERADLDAGRVA